MTPRYANPDPAHRPHGFRAILRWGIWDPLTGRRRKAPPGAPAPRTAPALDLIHSGASNALRLTWIGHASFLLQSGVQSVLIDPVFADHAGWIYRRYGQPGLTPAELPPLAAVLITHNHYDHLDLGFLGTVEPSVPLVAPAGLGRYLRRRLPQRVIELTWWERVELGELQITLVPSRHWSRRGIFDTNRTWWGGFVIEHHGRSIYHAGDSAWFDGFARIAERFPYLTVAILPIGGYRPAWFMEHNHLNPAQAGSAFEILGARWLIPMHWGAFQLTDEPLCEPAERMREWWQDFPSRADRHLVIPRVGETVVVEE